MQDSCVVNLKSERIFSRSVGYELCKQIAVMLLVLFSAYCMNGKVYDAQIIAAAIWLSPALLLGGIVYYAFWYLKGRGNDDSVIKTYVNFSQRYIAAGTVAFYVISSLQIK